MTGREFAKLARRHVLPHLSGFRVKDGLLFAVPVRYLLRGFSLYASAWSRERFTISCSAGLLYVPGAARALTPGLGARLPVIAGRGDAWWDRPIGDDEAEAAVMDDVRELIVDVGIPFLEGFGDPGAVAERLSREPEDDPHVVEALAYSLVLQGEYKLARAKLDRLRQITIEDADRADWWAAHADPGSEEDWVISVGKRGERVRELLAASPAKAVALLERWTEEQLAALRLPVDR